MSRTEIGSRRMGLWVVLGVAAMLCHYGGGGYFATVLAAGAILPLCLLFRDGFHRMGKVVSFLEWIWAMAVLGNFLPHAGSYWPGNASEIVVALALLAMAALAGGGEKAARAVNVLFWLWVLMIVPIALAAIGKIEPEWLAPVPGEWSAGLIVALLLPTLTSALVPEGSGKGKTVLTVAAIAVAAAAIMQGMLSPAVAGAVKAPLYELGRGLANGGYEILASVAATLGWYGFASLLFESAVKIAEQIGLNGKTGRIITFLPPSCWILMGLRLNGKAAIVGCLVGWILMPMLHQKIKSEKGEKSS